ncbi:MAG: hypothetical protein JXB49_08620 [Bacteroidales bacterium]|nr:hypothetical protein [Bacteroidales bacterium]
MDRNNKLYIFIVAILISIVFYSSALMANNSKNETQITTQEQAAKHAAKLANEKCQKDFGVSPFKPDLYKAELIDSKWHWGKIEPIGILGYSAKVEFNKDGTDNNVKVAFSTDKINNNEPELQKVPMEIEVIRPNELEKAFPKVDSDKDNKP